MHWGEFLSLCTLKSFDDGIIEGKHIPHDITSDADDELKDSIKVWEFSLRHFRKKSSAIFC